MSPEVVTLPDASAKYKPQSPTSVRGCIYSALKQDDPDGVVTHTKKRCQQHAQASRIDHVPPVTELGVI